MNRRRRKKTEKKRMLWNMALSGDNLAFACCSLRLRKRKKLIDDLSYEDIRRDFMKEFEKEKADMYKCEDLFWLLYLGDDRQQRMWRKEMEELFRIYEGRDERKAEELSHFLYLRRRKLNLNITYKRCKIIGNTI